MVIPIAYKVYSDTAELTFRSFYRCKHCGHRNPVRVVGVGAGTGRSLYSIDNQGAVTRAKASARHDALGNAKLTVALCPCPRCRKTGSWVHVGLANDLLGGLVLAVGIGAVTMFLLVVIGELYWWWIAASVGLFGGAVAFWRTAAWKWTTAEERVTFVAAEDAGKYPNVAGEFNLVAAPKTAGEVRRSKAQVAGQTSEDRRARRRARARERRRKRPTGN